MPVIWLIPVQDRLQETLGGEGNKPGALAGLLKRLGKQLQGTFPDAKAIVVTERLQGYSSQREQHVFRIETVSNGESIGRIVKIGKPDVLTRELRGWQDCRRPSNDRGRILMSVTGGKSTAADPEQYETLIYEDAVQTLRAARLMSLEDAVLRCVRWGTPTASSLQFVLNQIFTELADRLYRRSVVETPSAKSCSYWLNRLEPGLQQWESPSAEPGICQAALLSHLDSQLDFLNPASSLRKLLNDPQFLPEMRRGCVHGDLHGRNVLVGVVDGVALWPAIFDYEDMSAAGYLAWDFAKLEVELKIRALTGVYQGDEREFIQSVNRFETRLAAETERLHNLPFEHWVDAIQHATPEDRLLALLLTLRRHAKNCLEFMHRQGRRWLHEYYFVLACYGGYSGRFVNYQRREFLTSLLCAGLAAGRYAWAIPKLVMPEQVAQAAANDAIDRGRIETRLPAGARLSHRPEFVFARTFIRSRQPDFVRSGLEMLTELRTLFAHASEIAQETALGHFELFDLTKETLHHDQGEQVLRQIDIENPLPHPETLCRWGRLWKDRGDLAFDLKPDQDSVARFYETAMEFYKRACSTHFDYYPAVNVATMLFMTGRVAEAEKWAQDVLSDLQQRPEDPSEETVWILASRAEAYLLIGAAQDAATYYRSALLHRRCQPHHRDSMLSQVRRILRKRPTTEFRVEEVFR